MSHTADMIHRCRLLIALLICILLVGMHAAAMADTLAQAAEAARTADSLNSQLSALYDLSVRYAAELENGGWNTDLTFEPAGEIPEPFLPDPETATDSDTLPEELKEAKFITLYANNITGHVFLLGDFQVRLPEINRASSVEEADAVLLLSEQLTDRQDYTGPASNRVYEVFVAPKGGPVVRLYTRVTSPPIIGSGPLTGEKVSMERLWRGIQPAFRGADITLEYPEGTASFRITGEGCCMTGLEGAFVSYSIPQTVHGYPVLGIEKIWCDTLEQLTLPEGLTYISGDYAINCSRLKHMNFPSTLKRITGHYALDCPLQELNLNEGLEEIGSASIMGGHALEVYIPSTLTVMPESFLNQGACQPWIVIPDGVTRLERRFLWVSHWVQVVYIPESVVSFGDQIMTDQNLRIYTPDGSPASAWAEKNGHEWVACDHPENMPHPDLRYTENYTYFVNEDNEAVLLKYTGQDSEIVIPDSLDGHPVVRVSFRVFSGLDSLESLRLPDTVRTLEDYAVSDCPRLRTLFIPASVASMEKNAVDGCGHCVIYAPEGSAAHAWTKQNKLNGEKYEWAAWNEAE